MQFIKLFRLWFDLFLYPLIVVLAVWLAPHGTVWYAGLGFSFFMAIFWVIARIQLGKSFTVEAAARKLVTHGLYSKIRHPIYIFGNLSYLGAFVALQSWVALFIWAMLAAGEVRRAQREERVLAEAFGAEYEAYRAQTWF